MNINPVVLTLHIILGGLGATHALLYKRDPRAAMSWMGLCLILPFLGTFLYFIFGINRVQKRAHKLLYKSSKVHARTTIRNTIKNLSERDFLGISSQQLSLEKLKELSVLDKKIKRFTVASDTLCSHEMLANNSVSVLYNGDQAYPAMLKAIASAQSHIYLVTYIFRPDSIGKEFIQALADAKKRGVEVKIILDGIADWYYWPRTSRRMKKKGLDVVTFLALSWYPPSVGINLRNHKKLLLVDDRYAFTGGMNVSNINCLKNKNNKQPTQDIHFQIQGPVIEQCYALFAEVWSFVTKAELALPSYSYANTGPVICRALVDGPDEYLDKIELLFISAISLAEKTIRIMTPYFLPSRELISALNTATLRGVKVEVIVPRRSDNRIADWASQNLLWELLQRGIKIHAQTSPFAHSKIFIVDEIYMLIGSANIDARSLRLNYELMLEVIDPDLAAQLTQHCETSLIRSREITLEEVDGRSFIQRLRDSFCWLLLPYL